MLRRTAAMWVVGTRIIDHLRNGMLEAEKEVGGTMSRLRGVDMGQAGQAGRGMETRLLWMS